MSDVKDPLVAMSEETGDIIQGDEDRKAIVEYLQSEIDDVFNGQERTEMESDWAKWRRQREARPAQRSKSFPWENASNAAVPMAMSNTNGIFALLKSSIGAKKPFWVASSDDRMLSDQAKSWTTLLGMLAESRSHLNVRGANNTILYEVGSMGTQFVQIPWIVDKWYFKRRSPGGGTETVIKTARDTPVIIPIQLEDFGTRTHWPDLQRAPWIATRSWLYKHELQQRVAQGIYFEDAVEKVLSRGEDKIPDGVKETYERQGLNPSDVNNYAIYGVHLFWDIDNDGIPEDVKIWFDLTTGSILRSEFNELGVRDVVRIPYVNRPGQLYGIGVGWMVDHLQDEIDALHNMRVDGTMLSMLQMYVTRRGSTVAPEEDFRPLKNIQVDNPATDFIPIKFPDIGGTTIQAELMAKEYADRATGAADAMMGYESRSTSARTTAAGTMFLAQQGSKMFSAIKETTEEAYAEMGQLITYQLVANKERAKALLELLPMDQRAGAEQILALNVEDIPAKFKFRVQTADAEQSKEAMRQAKLTLTQLYTMYGQQVFQILPMVYSPQVPPQIKEVANKFFLGATKLMDDVFVSFGVQEADDYLPYIRDIEVMTQAIEAMKDMKLMQGGMGGGRGIQAQNSPQMGAGAVAAEGSAGPYGRTGVPAAGGPVQGPAQGSEEPSGAQ
jgi:hypothetical protein